MVVALACIFLLSTMADGFGMKGLGGDEKEVTNDVFFVCVCANPFL